MTTYYVGSGGNDGNAGTSWALRKLTLNGAEDIPVAANDTVYVGPGVYRELLTCDVSGSSGQPITYIADVTGENTDGVGGVVRITGSDDDQSSTRARCIMADTIDFRTFRGFRFDLTTNQAIYLYNDNDNIIIEDCTFYGGTIGVQIRNMETASNITIRRCDFLGYNHACIDMIGTGDASNILIENCQMFGGGRGSDCIQPQYAGITVRNCLMMGAYRGINLANATTGTIDVNNSILENLNNGFVAAATGDIVENYNTLWNVATPRTATNTGANSVTYPALLAMPILHAGASQASGFKFPWMFGELSEWSQVRAITGTGEPSVDMRGIARPATASKNSWGAVQFHDAERETTTTRNSSVASIVLHDAARHPMWVPVNGTQITTSVYVYREADYAGTAPQMVVKQPGQSDRTTTDAAAASQWNELTDTFTPSATPPYIVVELVSSNTAAAGNYDVFFDDLTVT